MSITKLRSSWLAILALLLLSSTTYAGVVGSYSTQGVLNVTFSTPNQKPVKTVSNSDEIWTFNANHTFSRGDVLTGHWKQTLGNVVEANYNRNAYNTYLSNFWANLGVTVSNIRILKNKVSVQAVSNGLSIEEILIYSMDVSENGGTKKAMVSIRGSFVAPDGASDNPALRKMFPTMWQDQAATASASSLTMRAEAVTITLQPSSDSTGSSNLATQSGSVLAQPAGSSTPQQ